MFRFITYLLLLSTILLSSCNEMSQEELQYNIQIYQTLRSDNVQLREKVKELKYDFEERLYEPRQYKTKYYKPHFDFAFERFNKLYDTLDIVSDNLVNELYRKGKIRIEYFANPKVFNKSYLENAKKKQIENLLKENNQILNLTIDTIKKMFLSDTLIIYNYNKESCKKDLEAIFRRDSTPQYSTDNKYILTLIDLELAKSKVILLEDIFLWYLNNNSIARFWGYHPDYFITKINSELLLRNQPIEVYAAVACYAEKIAPQIIINHQKIKLIDGMATYKTKAPSKKGKYTIPVVFEYPNPDGSISKVYKKLDYTVVDTICK